MTREVWLGCAQEGTVSIGIEDGSGSYTELAECEFAQDIKIIQLQEERVSYQPGKATPDFDWFPGGYDIAIGEFFLRKATQVTPYLVHGRKFRVALDLVNPVYTGVAPYENDTLAFRDAIVRVESLDVPDNDLSKIGLRFKAERME
ncbi:MAG: hypothetical protein ABIH03_14805 [Pseudomonadota bacterium]